MVSSSSALFFVFLDLFLNLGLSASLSKYTTVSGSSIISSFFLAPFFLFPEDFFTVMKETRLPINPPARLMKKGRTFSLGVFSEVMQNTPRKINVISVAMESVFFLNPLNNFRIKRRQITGTGPVMLVTEKQANNTPETAVEIIIMRVSNKVP